MTLKFCQKCKTLLSPQKKNGEVFLKCSKCGFESNTDLTSRENIPKKEKVGKGISKDENIFATYEHKCSKCGYDKAQVLDLGISYSDEDNLFLVKCGKCGFSERVGKDS
ncbi:hypothetical protein KAT80_00470 [Candidatus Pacearchaeota archaeon]|nr:hypothetical protein [Candidatus Pacearchaeota archaeon]